MEVPFDDERRLGIAATRGRFARRGAATRSLRA